MGEGRLLERYRDEIIQMYRQRKTQAQIRRSLEEKYNIGAMRRRSPSTSTNGPPPSRAPSQARL
jgi:hypothetical protein